MSFQFNPVTGLNDASQFPDEDPLIRQHLQSLLKQIPDYYDEQFANNLNVNGWQKLANGLIIQCGELYLTPTTSTHDTGNVSFPIAFPNSGLSIAFSLYPTDITSWVSSGFINGYIYSNTSYRAVLTGVQSGKPYKLKYIAIGF